jgi:hypothetical protein
MLEWLPIDLIVEIGMLAGPDEYEELAKTSERNAIILHKPYIAKAINSFIVKKMSGFDEHFTFLGELHSFNDMPASIYKSVIDNCSLHMWFRYGKLHRDNDMPAIMYSDGSQSWYQYGKLHRDNDMPAIMYSDGSQSWYQYGELHRNNDMPAQI